MARCLRCKKFMLFASESGNCKECDIAVLEERHKKEVEERKKQEAARKLNEELKRREEERIRAEEQKRREEEERLKKEREKTDQEYHKALLLFSEAITIDQFKTAKQVFLGLNDYQDSKVWILKCNDCIENIRREEHQRKIEEEKRLREEEERKQREEQEQEERKRLEEQRRLEEQKRLEEELKRKEEQKRQEEEQRRLEEELRIKEERRRQEEERIHKEKERLRIKLKDQIILRKEELKCKETESKLYNEEEKQFALEGESYYIERSEAYEIAIKTIKNGEANMSPYSFGGEKVTSKTAMAYALNANWAEGKKHMLRGLILEHFKRDFDADIISKLMDIDEDDSTDDPDIKLFRYIRTVNQESDVLLWKNKMFKDISDFGLQYLKAIKYGNSLDIDAFDEIIEKNILKLYLGSVNSNSVELEPRIEAFREYIEEVKKNKTAENKIKRSLLAYSLAKDNDQAVSVLYSLLVHEERKLQSLALVERKLLLTHLSDAFSALDDFEDSCAHVATCKEKVSQIDEILSKYNVGSIIYFGQFWQEDDSDDNEKTDLEWIVLHVEQSKALLISKYVVYSYPYGQGRWQSEGAEWSKSTVREMLNGFFYRNAFNMEEQAAILSTEIDNSNKQHYYSQKYSRYINNTEENIQDKLFILSYAEAWKYFPTEESRKCYETAYAYGQAKKYGFGPKQLGLIWWWLRSPGYLYNSAPIVNVDGKFDFDNVNDISGGVRPALWLNLEPDYSWLE